MADDDTHLQCNFCRGTEFVPMNGRPSARCAHCHSLERTRLLWMFLQRLPLTAETKILHVAPERPLYRALSRMTAPGNYVTADYYERRYHRFAPACRHIDLCALDGWPDNEFDLIIHSHVLEHTPCNVAYTLYHLHRMLTDTGRHVCIIPFMSGRFDESFQELDPSERQRRFGQHDHVRRFGRADRAQHLGKLLNLPDRFDASATVPQKDLARANIPEEQYRGFGIATVLDLGKYDMKLLRPPSPTTNHGRHDNPWDDRSGGHAG